MISTIIDDTQCPSNGLAHEFDKDGFCNNCGDPVAQSIHDKFQDRVQFWLEYTFGTIAAQDKLERVHRFIEEGLELAQSLGCTQQDAHKLVDYVFGREVGEPLQELGGTMTTIAALSAIFGFDMEEAGEIELQRMWENVEKIRIKQKAKPKYSPLPQ